MYEQGRRFFVQGDLTGLYGANATNYRVRSPTSGKDYFLVCIGNLLIAKGPLVAMKGATTTPFTVLRPQFRGNASFVTNILDMPLIRSIRRQDGIVIYKVNAVRVIVSNSGPGTL